MESTAVHYDEGRGVPPVRDVRTLRDGATVSLSDGTLELRDAEGALLVRYADGNAEVYAPGGDLTLAAPSGRVVLRSGSDVEIDAAERLVVQAEQGSFNLGKATLAARRVATCVTTVSHQVERYELVAKQLVERASDAFRDVSGVLQARVGRMRTLVAGEHVLHARRNVQVSRDETRIDGKHILLG